MSNEFPTNVFVAPAQPFPSRPVDEIAAVREQVAQIPQPGAGDTVDSLEAAGILTVTENNLRQMVHKKQLTPVGKRGRRTLFDRAEVTALAERRRK
jgi:hypothetical protein